MEIMQQKPVKDAKALLGDVPRHSVREVIAGKLAALISSGILSQGDALPSERELAISLSVSRETVRGSIAILAERGILLVTQGARTTVADADLSRTMAPGVIPQMDGPYGLKSVHEARLLVECRIGAEAARHATPQVLEAMRRSLAAQEACDDDPVRFLLADREFHGLLYNAAGNDVLADIAMSLHTHLLDHRRRIIAQPGAIGVSIEDHRAILSAIERRDVETTVTAVSAHVTRIYDTTRAFLEPQPD
ncbi:FCD domain-containing protein [Hoeflea sp.]|uniref:FadR/GntR family transcriptional regulator n=1 Tax=Hoeflea sp. TaxID=1940281 RepID=UPI002AFED86D|nr:FCD domain-containing protein [Hoeflea sp.]